MAGRNVIQDSDDEDNVEGSPPPPPPSAPGTSELSLSTIVDLPSSPPSRVLQQSGQPSTELLNREIQDAHNSLLAPTPAGALSSTKSKRRSTQQPSVSPSVSKTKSRRATTIGSERGEKKTLKTYGSKGSQDIFEFRGSSDGEQDVFCSRGLGSVSKSRNSEEPRVDGESKKGTRDTAQYERLGHYEAEFHNDADKPNLHLPNKSHQKETSPGASLHSSMLPPTLKPFVETQTQRPESSTASTVPFDTPPKLTPIEDAGSFKFLASNDRMPTPTVSSKSRSDAEKPVGSSQSSANSKKRQVEVLSPSFKKYAQPESSDCLPLGKRARTEENYGVIPSSEQHQNFQEDTIQEGLPLVLSSRIDNLVQSLPQIADRAAIEKMLEECGGNMDVAASRLLDAEEKGGDPDELSLSGPLPAMGSAKIRSSKSDKKREVEGKQHIDKLGSDEVEIGFPKEQYQPRPSRSRSGQGEEDGLVIPVDFSKRPEALVKPKKSKRRKTTALAKATPKYEEEEEDVTPLFSFPESAQHFEPEFKITPGRVELVETETPWADPEAQSDQEFIPAANLPAPKEHKGRPHKKATERREVIPEEQALLDDGVDEPDAEITEDPLAEEILEASRPFAPKKRRGRPHKKAPEPSEKIPEEQLFADDDEEDPDKDLGKDIQEDPGDHEVISASKTPAAKKQRGRPKKKSAKAPEDIPSDDDGNKEPLEPSKPPLTKNPRKRKKSTLGDPPNIDNDNDDPPPLLNEPPHPNPLSETQANTAPTLSPPPSTKHTQQPETPQKPSAASQQKGPDKHSPLQSGKVRYRVGLSKRARIEPLLRVVRK